MALEVDYGGTVGIDLFVPDGTLRLDYGGVTRIDRPPSPPRTVVYRLWGEWIALTERDWVDGAWYPPL